MQQLLKEGDDLWYDWQQKGAKHAEKIAQLEIDIRQEELSHKTHDVALIVSSSYVIVKSVLDEGLPSEIKLSEQELADMAVFEALKTLDNANCKALLMEDGTKLAEDYAKYRGTEYNNLDIEQRLNEEKETLLRIDSMDYIKAVLTTVATLLPLLTTKLWSNEEPKEKERKISAALKKLLKPKAMEKANQDVEKAMDSTDANNPSDALLSIIDQRAKTDVGKEVQHLKRHIRKNSSGDDKNQASTPKKSGQKPNASSESLSANSNCKSKKNTGKSNG